MHKKWFLYISVLMIALPCAANIMAVNLANLPKETAYRNLVDYVLDNLSYADHYTVDWKHPVEKSVLLEKLVALEERTGELITREYFNYDLHVFDMVLLSYIYNLDSTGASKISAKAVSMQKDFPDKYQTSWVFGNFLSSAAKPVEAIGEFDKVLAAQKGKHSLPSSFYEDYAAACYIATMFKTSMRAYETAGSIKRKSAESYSIYNAIKGIFVEPDPESEYKDTEVWKLIPYRDDYKLTSRLMGISLPIRKDWTLQCSGYSKKQAFVYLRPDRILSKKGNSIGISMLYVLSAENTSFEEFQATCLKGMPVTAKGKKTVNGRKFDMVTYEDKTKYTNIGGAIGYYAFTAMDVPDQYGMRIEYPFDIGKNGPKQGTGTYYRPNATLDRFRRNIYIGIMLDACNEIIPEATDFFWKEISETVFD